jgi:pimeloyl-ACP methyl ester carboxylesterase
MPAERFDFPNAAGQKLAALLDRPDGPMRTLALFAHCFTCGKSNRAARRIAEGLKVGGVGVLRFDFTGLGASEGEFANTTFSSNVEDLIAAADHLRLTLAAPALLIGHSLGGAAVLAAAQRIPEAQAVVTVGAPFDPAHVIGLFGEKIAEIGDKDDVEVTLTGRHFRVRRAFLEDVKKQNLENHLKRLQKALLIFHSPIDDTVDIENANHIFAAANHPKSFISLAGADHLLSEAGDAAYVAHLIMSWADHYFEKTVETGHARA